MTDRASAAREWRQFGLLPIAAGMGYSTAVLSTYGLGPFFEPLQREFGWSRGSIAFGLTIVGLSGALASVPLGLLVDRFGPRRVGLLGGLLVPLAFALLGTATGSLANWYLLWSIMALASFTAQGTIWVAAVNRRFVASRGLAIAITMCGGSLTSAVLPVLATVAMTWGGWRMAFLAVGASWLVLAYPLIILFFRVGPGGATGRPPGTPLPAASPAESPAELPAGVTLSAALRMRQFYQLIGASGFYTFAGIGTIVHFVPILTDRGAKPLAAAGVASLVGLCSVLGRLGAGLLLDRFAAHIVGAAIFLLPLLSCGLLLADGANPTSQILAAVFFGLNLGAEVDVIAYLTARQFGLRNYGALFGAMTAALAIGTALGPLAAGALFDRFGGYTPFLILTMILMALSAAAVAALGPDPAIDRNRNRSY